jgi:hypothetical protein
MNISMKKVTSLELWLTFTGTTNPSVEMFKNPEKAWTAKPPMIPGSQDFLTDLYRAVNQGKDKRTV